MMISFPPPVWGALAAVSLDLSWLTALWRRVAPEQLASTLHDTTALELAVVAAYFTVMLALSAYGLHRYVLIRLYYRNADRADPRPLARFQTLPTVTVQLPVYNERFVVEALIESAAKLDYPRDRLQIQVLDDSNDDTRSIARRAVERLAARGTPIEYIHRAHREGYKAGALGNGLRTAKGELIAVFDADFAPQPDFLLRTVDHFTDPRVGVVQARWTFRNSDASLLTRVQAMLLDGHFVFEHGGRFRSGRFFNFNGTAGVLRREMIEDAGGWQHDTLTEDTDLSYRAQLKGWKFVYVAGVEVPSELPVDVPSFQAQQARWAKGLTQTALKILPRLFRSRQPRAVKAEAFFHLTANLSYPLMVVLSLLLVPSLLIRYEHWGGRGLWIDAPLFLATFSSLSTFYLMAQKELRPRTWTSKICLIPALVAAGIGLTLSNARGVVEALLGVKTPFERTAKHGGDPSRLQPSRQLYGLRAGWLPWANLAGGLFFAWSLLFAVELGAWATTPFLALFVFGYFYAGGMALRQSRISARKPRPAENARLREAPARPTAFPG